MRCNPARPSSLAFVALSLALTAGAARGQVRGSERATVSQISDGTTVVIDYGRPHVRGRSPAFPGIVGWGHVWTPGANSSTTLTVSRAVKLNGVAVPEGAWSVWFVPAEGEWEVVLDPDERLYHTQEPEASDDQVRFRVTPEQDAFTEALTWEVPQVDGKGMDLRFRWDEVRIDFRIDVEPTPVPPTPEHEARAIAGTYQLVLSEAQRARAEAAGMSGPPSFELHYEDGLLIGEIPMGPGVMAPFELFPRASWVYSPGWIMNGQVVERELEMLFEFVVSDGQVTGFEVRGVVDDRIDRVMMSAERVR